MKNIMISGLVNTETTVRVRRFPIEYYPIDYPFFGVSTSVSGVAYNIARALRTLGDRVSLISMTGKDFPAAYIRDELGACGIPTDHITDELQQTPSSVVLYDGSGRRQIYCDLKDIQESACNFDAAMVEQADLVVACNINFNRPLLHMAKAAGKIIATDVHVLSDIHDGYNRDFMAAADILFLSDEAIGEAYQDFLWELSRAYGNQIIVLGRGSKGAAMYLRGDDRIFEYPAVRIGEVVNTVGAGDALFSAFVHFVAAGKDPHEALRRAQIFASAKIGSNGASNGFVPEEVLQVLYQKFDS